MTDSMFRAIPADRPATRELVDEVRAVLGQGGLVGLPTETVYGIAARADHPGALERLRRLKSVGGRPFTWHAPSAAVLEAFPELAGYVGRLAERYWPGPLTLVLKGVPPGLEAVAREGWTGVRVPAHEATRSVLAGLDFPVVATSANAPGGSPAVDASEVLRVFAAELALVLDAGRSRLGEGSSVLAVGPGRFDMLREGLITAEDLRRQGGLRIGFVCTGNTCRSPMAAAIGRSLLADRLRGRPERAGDRGQARARATLARFGYEITSAGLAAPSGSPAARHAIEILADTGVDLSRHRSRPAVPEAIATLDRVYGFTAAHLDALRALLPPGRAEALQLLDPTGRDVPDPVGGTLDDYRRCAERIRELLRIRVLDWV